MTAHSAHGASKKLALLALIPLMSFMFVPMATAASPSQPGLVGVLMEVQCISTSSTASSGATLTYAHVTIVVLCPSGTEHGYSVFLLVGKDSAFKATAFAGNHHSSWSGKFGVNECGTVLDNAVGLAHSETYGEWTLVGCFEDGGG
jgi:hypothetical protein